MQRCIIAPSHNDRCMLLRRVQQGHILQPVRGMYIDNAYWNGLHSDERMRHITRAYAHVHPNWIFEGLTAACMHRLDHDYELPHRTISVLVPSPPNARAPHWMQYRQCEDAEYAIVDGVKVTPLANTVADCLCTHDFCNGLQMCNDALRRGVTRTGITDILESMPHATAGAWNVVQHATPRCENGGESRALAVMIEGGLQVPQLQREFHCAQNGETRRADYCWTTESGLIVGELDGREKYIDPAMTGGRMVEEIVDDERMRVDTLMKCGVIRIVRFRVRETFDPPAFIDKLMKAGVPRVPR